MYVGVFVCLYGPSPHVEVIRRRLSGTSTLFICTVFVLLFSDTAEGFSYAFLFFCFTLIYSDPLSLFFFHAPSFSCFYRLCSVHSRSLSSFFFNLFSKRFFFLVVVAVSSRLSRLSFFFVGFVCVCVVCA